MKKIGYLTLLLFLACGSEEGANTSDCDIAGEWDIAITDLGGTCFGQAELKEAILVINEADVINDPESCGAVIKEDIDFPETAELYGVLGTSETTLYRDGDDISGNTSITGSLIENGVSVGECLQTYSIMGTR